MKTIELQHLAPYLPYKLNYFIDFEDGDVAVYEMIGMFTDSGEIYLDGYETNLDSQNCKPILRPLSDLTEKVLKDIKKMMLVDFEYIDKDGIQSIHFPTGNISITSIHYEIVEECPLGFYNYLLKHHFDVFGLIEKGLAIDKNTL
tara:strand:- start:12 stop:446 length:435 start_codon:yes stop_codon:yes gene_type:complete